MSESAWLIRTFVLTLTVNCACWKFCILSPPPHHHHHHQQQHQQQQHNHQHHDQHHDHHQPSPPPPPPPPLQVLCDVNTLQDTGHGWSVDAVDAVALQSRRLCRSVDDFDARLARRLGQSVRLVDVRTVGRRDGQLHDAARLGDGRQRQHPPVPNKCESKSIGLIRSLGLHCVFTFCSLKLFIRGRRRWYYRRANCFLMLTFEMRSKTDGKLSISWQQTENCLANVQNWQQTKTYKIKKKS